MFVIPHSGCRHIYFLLVHSIDQLNKKLHELMMNDDVSIAFELKS